MTTGTSEESGSAEVEALEAEAVQAAEANAEWWNREWLKFPTVSLDEEGRWHYWDVPADTGVYKDDWRIGEGLARDTVAQMQRFMAGSSALRRILREIDHDSTVGQGFLTRIEDMLSNPDLYLASLEPGSVRKKLQELAAAAEQDTSAGSV